MGNANKDSDSGTTEAGAESSTTARDARDVCHATHSLSWERETRDTTLAKQVVEAVAREMAKAHAHYQALLNERGTATMLTSLKMTSRALGFKFMDPFDWTKDKAIYQRWKMWSEKARHALDAMEGDSEKTKSSYSHHWVDSEGMAQIESWKNNKTIISQENYEKLDEDQKEGKYSLDKIESYFTPFDASPQVKSIIGCQRIMHCQARFYQFWRVSCICSKNCEKMQISLWQSRSKSHQGHHFPRHEVYKSQGQSHKFDE